MSSTTRRNYAFHLLPILLVACTGAPEPPKPPQSDLDLTPCPGSSQLEDRTEPRVLLDLSMAQLRDASGRHHGGWLARNGDGIEEQVPWVEGRYLIEAWATTTQMDGTPGQLTVQVGQNEVATLHVPEGPARRVEAHFTIPKTDAASLALRFSNDLAAEGRDRNILLHRVRLTRESSPSIDTRMASLRQATHGANLILISIDTLRADHLSVYGYGRDTSPQLESLAARGTVFTNAVSASSWTAPSHATMLTGRHMREHGVRTQPGTERLPDEIETLAEVLRDAGYRTAGMTAGIYVNENGGFRQGFELWEQIRLTADERFDRASEWLSNTPEDKPFFLFLHTFEVHEPLDPPPPYDRMYFPEYVEDEERTWRKPASETWFQGIKPTAEDLRFIQSLYDGEIRYTDAALGRMLDGLQERGQADRTLVVVTSDHGEEFLDHGSMGHGQLYGELLRVPLILAHPALQRLADPQVDQVTGSVDLLPTLTDLLGVETPANLSGRSLVPALTGRVDTLSAAYSSKRRGDHTDASVITRTGHFIEGGRGLEYFRMDNDRFERSNVAGDETEAVKCYLTAFKDLHERLSPLTTPASASFSEEEREMLQALGYIAK